VILLILSLVGRMPGRAIGAAVLLMVLFTLQSVFVALRDSAPAIAALHPLNGVAIFTLALWTARAASAWAQPASRPAPDAAPAEAM
jgi:hypothetical protein